MGDVFLCSEAHAMQEWHMPVAYGPKERNRIWARESNNCKSERKRERRPETEYWIKENVHQKKM